MGMITKAAATPQFPPSPFTDPQLARRLAGHGIRNLQDWHELSRSQRRGLFGITRRVVEQLDALAKAVHQ
jgi:hypothetical protein